MYIGRHHSIRIDGEAVCYPGTAYSRAKGMVGINTLVPLLFISSLRDSSQRQCNHGRSEEGITSSCRLLSPWSITVCWVACIYIYSPTREGISVIGRSLATCRRPAPIGGSSLRVPPRSLFNHIEASSLWDDFDQTLTEGSLHTNGLARCYSSRCLDGALSNRSK